MELEELEGLTVVDELVSVVNADHENLEELNTDDGLKVAKIEDELEECPAEEGVSVDLMVEELDDALEGLVELAI